MWNNKYRDQFENLEMTLMPAAGDDTSYKTILQKMTGERTQELDVSYAIGREEDVDINILRQRLKNENFNSDFEPYIPQSSRRLLGASEKKLKKMYDSEVIDYIPVKYIVNSTYDANTAFIPTKFDVNVKKDKANISIEVLDFKHSS